MYLPQPAVTTLTFPSAYVLLWIREFSATYMYTILFSHRKNSAYCMSAKCLGWGQSLEYEFELFSGRCSTFPAFIKKIRFSLFSFSSYPFTSMCRFSDTFFEFFCTHATQFHSNLRSKEVCCISFLGKKTELVYLWYSSFYTCFCTIVKFCTKKRQKSGAHC